MFSPGSRRRFRELLTVWEPIALCLLWTSLTFLLPFFVECLPPRGRRRWLMGAASGERWRRGAGSVLGKVLREIPGGGSPRILADLSRIMSFIQAEIFSVNFGNATNSHVSFSSVFTVRWF